jgi:hypothetical protein
MARSEKLNLQTASLSELRQRLGISETIARAIIAARPIHSIKRLLSISGISKGLLRRWTLEGAHFGRLAESGGVRGEATAVPVPFLSEMEPSFIAQGLNPRDLLLAMAPPGPCCQRVTQVRVGNIRMRRRTPGSGFPNDYEAPLNNIFDRTDEIEIVFDFMACLPVDIRVEVVNRKQDVSDTLISLDNQGVGGGPAADGRITNPAGGDIYTYERTDFDLTDELVLMGASDAPAEYELSIVVRDDCGRIGVGLRKFVWVRF